MNSLSWFGLNKFDHIDCNQVCFNFENNLQTFCGWNVYEKASNLNQKRGFLINSGLFINCWSDMIEWGLNGGVVIKTPNLLSKEKTLKPGWPFEDNKIDRRLRKKCGG